MLTPPHNPGDFPPGKTNAGQRFLARSRAFNTLLRRLGPVGPVALISMTVPAIMGFVMLGAAKYHDDAIGVFIHDHRPAAVALYIVGFVILAGFPVLPTYAVSLAGGYFFGLRLGFGASLAGYTGAALLSYAFLHVLSGDRVERVIAEHPKWKIVRDELLVRSTWRTLCIVALLRLPPNLPFAVVNLVIVTARIPLGTYIAGTMMGVVPRTAAVVFIGSATRKLGGEEGAPRMWWLTVIGIALSVLVIAFITQQAHSALRKMSARGASARSGAEKLR